MARYVSSREQLSRRVPFGTRIYTIWFGMIVLGVVSYLFRSLRPLWRVLGGVGPFFLALDADAGDLYFVYYIKTGLVLLMDALLLYQFFDTNGFEEDTPSSHAIFAVISILFIASCVITFVGHRLRDRIVVTRSTPAFTCNELVPVDPCVFGTPYADFEEKTIRTPLKPVDLRDAWEDDGHGGRRPLTPKEVHTGVLRTCFITQYVMSRIYKSPKNHIYVFSMVAWYRTRVFLLLAALTGLCDVGNDLFRTDGTTKDVASKAILWLTLPSITIPALLKIRFGTHARLNFLMCGLLPVTCDREMWLRIGVGPSDLYCALTNAVPAERVLDSTIGLINGAGKSNVKVCSPKLARRASIDSLLRVSDYYVRVFDGRLFQMFRPDTLKVVRGERYTVRDRNNVGGFDKGSARRYSHAEYDAENPEGDSDWWGEWETWGGVLQVAKQSWDDEDRNFDALTDRSDCSAQKPRLQQSCISRCAGVEKYRELLLRLLASAFGDGDISSVEEYERLKNKVETGVRCNGNDEHLLLCVIAGAFVQGKLQTSQFRGLQAFLQRRSKTVWIPFKRRGSRSDLLLSERKSDAVHSPDDVEVNTDNPSSETRSEDI